VGDDPREQGLKLVCGGGWDGLEAQDPVGEAIDANGVLFFLTGGD